MSETDEKKKKSRSEKIREARLQIRNGLWPGLDESFLWHRKKDDGYTTIPRGMSHFLNIVDHLIKGNPLSSTYLTLWYHASDEMFFQVRSSREMAFESGFIGQRAETTWKSKMKALKDLHFIDTKPGPTAGEFTYVLIYNPYAVINCLWQQDATLIREDIYNALLSRANEIGAKDFFKFKKFFETEHSAATG